MKSIEMLRNRARQKNTFACCGLDPDKSKLPQAILKMDCSDREKMYIFLKTVIEITAPHVCAYKIQKACFDILPSGYNLLKEIIAYIHEKHPGIPVIIDCKIGDIDNTMEIFYAPSIFDRLKADGVVVNPYMGDEVFTSLEGYPDKIVVVLVKTSNKGSAVVQDIVTQSGQKVWEVILDLAMNRWDKHGNIVPVISSTAGVDLQKVRQAIPNKTPILFAGVGAQGGSYNGFEHLFTDEESCAFANSSRKILYSPAEEGKSWQDLVEERITELKNELNVSRRMRSI